MVGSIASSPSVDLSTLSAPTLVDQPDFETRFAAKLAAFLAAYLEETGTDFSALLESDPAYQLLEADTYDEITLAQAFQEVAKARLLAYATGTDLDQLGALVDVARLTVTEATDTTDAVMEGDTAYKRRIQMAPHAFSVAGPQQAYVFHALSTDATLSDATATSPEPEDIKALVLDVLAANDASAEMVTAMTTALDNADWPGDVTVTLLSSDDSGVPDDSVIAAVDTVLQDDEVRPMTDHVTVQAAEMIDYAIEAELYVFAGPDQALILEAAQEAMAEHLATIRKLGRDVARSGHIAALHVGNVQRVNLISPPADITIDDTQCGNPISVSIRIAGTEQ